TFPLAHTLLCKLQKNALAAMLHCGQPVERIQRNGGNNLSWILRVRRVKTRKAPQDNHFTESARQNYPGDSRAKHIWNLSRADLKICHRLIKARNWIAIGQILLPAQIPHCG